jgi:adenylosuccinate synthase
MLLNPIRLLKEDDELRTLGVTDALARISIDRQALVTTPFQVAANRLRELARGDARHGSCGMGIGETMADWLAYGDEMVFAADLQRPESLSWKLERVRALKLVQLADLPGTLPETDAAQAERRIFSDPDVIESCVRTYTYLAGQVRIVDGAYLGMLLDLPGTVLFEGAQGALLDEWRGFHPYTTWSTTTFKNALTLLDEHGYDGEIVKLGLLRGYTTRHGAGPLVTEDPRLRPVFTDPYNVTNNWQQGFRVGPFDVVATRYAIEVAGRPDLVAVSHLDQIERLRETAIAVAYRYTGNEPDVGRYVDVDDGLIVRLRPSPAPEDLEYQARLTTILERCEPVIRTVRGGTAGLLDAIEAELGVTIGLVSAGPAADDKGPRPRCARPRPADPPPRARSGSG